MSRHFDYRFRNAAEGINFFFRHGYNVAYTGDSYWIIPLDTLSQDYPHNAKTHEPLPLANMFSSIHETENGINYDGCMAFVNSHEPLVKAEQDTIRKALGI